MIFSQSGELVWFDPLAGETEATNLQVQQLYGKPVLTWWQGYIPPQGFGEGEEMIDNSAYQQVGRVHAGNGYKVDLHDFHITAQGTALLTMFNPIDCNLSAVGGPSGGAVTDSGFQEIDLATGLVRREWTSLDHIGLSDSYSSPEQASTAWPFDYFHINSIDQLPGSTALISARNTWALYELNTSTGQVVLQVGGKHGEVKALSGAATAFQHDATVLGKRHDQRVRQRRDAEGPSPVAGDRTVGQPTGQDRYAAGGLRALLPAAVLFQPGQRAGARQRRHVRGLGLGAVLL